MRLIAWSGSQTDQISGFVITGVRWRFIVNIVRTYNLFNGKYRCHVSAANLQRCEAIAETGRTS